MSVILTGGVGGAIPFVFLINIMRDLSPIKIKCGLFSPLHLHMYHNTRIINWLTITLYRNELHWNRFGTSIGADNIYLHSNHSGDDCHVRDIWQSIRRRHIPIVFTINDDRVRWNVFRYVYVLFNVICFFVQKYSLHEKLRTPHRVLRFW